MNRRLLLTCTVLAVISRGQCADLSADDTTIRRVIERVAQHQIHPLRDGDYAPADSTQALRVARPAEGIAWLYPWGVTLYGMLQTSAVTGDPAPARFVLTHDQVAARDFTFLEAERSRLGANALTGITTPIDRLLALGNLDSCGAMGVAMLEGVLRHSEAETPEVKAVLARIADWIVHRQSRMPDGTLCRPIFKGGVNTGVPGTLWCDDLYMACPFLVRWSQYTGDPRYLDDAAQQIIHMAALLQDTDGVWFHAYFIPEHRHSPVKWGRANGWVVVATADVLSALPPDHPARPRLLAILRKQLDGLKPLQATSGMWRQVLDHPELWEETSCTAMFAYGYARAANRGWIDPSGLAIARRAFAGVATQVTPDGAVNGTCQGTGIGRDIAFYAARQRPPDDLHGRGVVQLAGAEILAGPSRALPRAAAESEGVSSAAVADFVAEADRKIRTLHSFMLVRHGVVIAEGWWKPHAAAELHVMHSLSKSVTSTAVGLAIAEGKLNLDDRVVKFFPGVAPADPSPNLAAMRIRDLLTLTDGHETEPKFSANMPWIRRFFAQPVPHAPGTHFLYDSSAVYMLSVIVQKVTGQTLLDYLRPRVFDPLGIFDATWDLSPTGVDLGYAGLHLCTEDVAKYGLLYLQHGRWNGNQVIPAGWAEASTTTRVRNDQGDGARKDMDSRQGYGYLFWMARFGAYRASGAFGQFSIVLPKEDAVVAITADTPAMQTVMPLVLTRLRPLLQGQALDPDPAGVAKLRLALGTRAAR